MTNTDALILIMSQVRDMILFMLPIIAVTAVVKIVFDNLHNFLFGITGKNR